MLIAFRLYNQDVTDGLSNAGNKSTNGTTEKNLTCHRTFRARNSHIRCYARLVNMEEINTLNSRLNAQGS